ncbi:BTB/POZ protein [Sporodiniella umbellata]|nr:BTB/POZ protein [Sporodiniella umbellata]
MDQAKQNYQAKMDASYRAFHSDLVDQCHQVIQEAKENNTSRFRSMPSNEKVRLNVGGSLFETSYGTLSRDSQSLLAAMFSGRHRLSLEPEGAYFLDRDPLHFRLVLNYLRDLRVPPAILQDTTIREELLQEAHYYRIQGLVDLLSRREDQKSR